MRTHTETFAPFDAATLESGTSTESDWYNRVILVA